MNKANDASKGYAAPALIDLGPLQAAVKGGGTTYTRDGGVEMLGMQTVLLTSNVP